VKIEEKYSHVVDAEDLLDLYPFLDGASYLNPLQGAIPRSLFRTQAVFFPFDTP
jgi:hypothetical protein